MNRNYFYPDRIPIDTDVLDNYLKDIIKNPFIKTIIPKNLYKQSRTKKPKDSYYFFEETNESQITRGLVLRRHNIDVLMIKQNNPIQEPSLYTITDTGTNMVQPSKLEEAKIELPKLF